MCSVLNFAAANVIPVAAVNAASHHPPPADDHSANMARSELARPPFNIEMEQKLKQNPPDSIEKRQCQADPQAPPSNSVGKRSETPPSDSADAQHANIAYSTDEDAPGLTQHVPKIAARNQLLNPHHNPHYVNELGEEVEFDPQGHEIKVHARPNDVPLMLRHKHYINEAGDEVTFSKKGQEVIYYGGVRGQKAPWDARKHPMKLHRGQFRIETNDAGESVAFDEEGMEHRLFKAEDGTVHAEHTRLGAKAKRELKRDCVRQPHHKHCVEEIADNDKAKRGDPCKKHPNGKKCQKQEDKEDESDGDAELADRKVKRELQGKDPCDKHPNGKKCQKQQEQEQKTDDDNDEPPGDEAAVSEVNVEAKRSEEGKHGNN